jgi:protein-tyrosine phosphatase
VIDLHSHILPGLDDGAATASDSLALARAASSVGVTTIAATPHVRDDYPTSPDEMEQGVKALGQALADAGIAVEIAVGGELSLDRLDRLAEEDVARFSLGGTGRYLLVEFPYYGWPFTLEAQLRRLRGQGLIPVLAHPERNPEVQQAPHRLERLRRGGALAQVTIDSLTGVLGRRARRAARDLLEANAVDLLAFDSHAPAAYSLDAAGLADAVGDRRLAHHLTVDVPAAILAGDAVI